MITQIIRDEKINADLDAVWDFMSSPKNLEKITPTNMMFKITSRKLPEKIHPGMIISYKVSPILNIPLNWVTEITHVKDKNMFVDEQRLGPYKMWHHQHIFNKEKDGVLMKDIITYIPPLGFIGNISNKIFIKKKVNNIFDYRSKILNEIFNA